MSIAYTRFELILSALMKELCQEEYICR